MAGRGFGKSRTGAEWVRAQAESGARGRIALVAATAGDARDVMVEGESGLLAIAPPWFRPRYEPSKRRVTWPNGAMATLYSADEPERLRGPQHDGGWADELAAWRYLEAWDMLMFGMRLGDHPQTVVTTTPKPAHSLLKDLLSQPTTAVTTGSSYDNRANLAPAFFEQIIRKYEGTSLGQQELMGLLLEEAEGALWRRAAMIDAHRVSRPPERFTRIVVGVDPSITSTGAETGIIVAGLGPDMHGYVLHDGSLRGSPDAWATAAVAAYHVHRADRLIAEANQGGEMVARTIGTVTGAPPVTLVRASRGKQTRAEPIAALYEQGRVHHVGGFPDLEAQMCSWVPGEDSPDRMDALVWALTALLLPDEDEEKAQGMGLYAGVKGW